MAIMALPSHPLPLYFAVAALCILVVVMYLVHRGCRAGTLFVAFALLWPIAKITLETLRAFERLDGLMIGAPLVLFGLGIVMLCVQWRSDRRGYAR
jgi:prolipoprotein diacylglyceryltransferase